MILLNNDFIIENVLFEFQAAVVVEPVTADGGVTTPIDAVIREVPKHMIILIQHEKSHGRGKTFQYIR